MAHNTAYTILTETMQETNVPHYMKYQYPSQFYVSLCQNNL